MSNLLSNSIKSFKETTSNRFNVDINLIILFCVIAQHSFMIKLIGIGLLTLMNFSSIKSIRLRSIPLFYSLIPAIEILKFFLVDQNFSNGHIAQFVVGICYWLASLVLCWIVFSRVQLNNEKTTENSIKFFSVLNFLFSVYQITSIALLEGVINPYNTGHPHPFGVSTGDQINGLLHGVHLSNAFISILLILYFLFKKDYLFISVSLIPFLLCGSNYGSITLIFCLGIAFIVSNHRLNTFIISTLIVASLLFFYFIVTPINAHHTLTKLNNLVGNKVIVDEEYQTEVDNKIISKMRSKTIDSTKFTKDENEALNRLKKVAITKKYDFGFESGKKTSYKQTFAFLRREPKYFLFGAGMGAFSSNLAFNFSGVVDNSKMNKLFPNYETKYFVENHKSIYSFMKISHIVFHSESNRPFSVYNQLFGEYGVLGFLLFLVTYIYYFFKRVDKRAYAIPIIIALLILININYFIESLNLLLFFEALMFLNIKYKTVNERDKNFISSSNDRQRN